MVVGHWGESPVIAWSSASGATAPPRPVGHRPDSLRGHYPGLIITQIITQFSLTQVEWVGVHQVVLVEVLLQQLSQLGQVRHLLVPVGRGGGREGGRGAMGEEDVQYMCKVRGGGRVMEGAMRERGGGGGRERENRREKARV